MPLLGALIAKLFGSIAFLFGAYISKKALIVGSALATFGTLTFTLYQAQSVLFNSIIPQLPGGQLIQTALWLGIPDSAPAVIAACLATDTAIAIYRMNLKVVDIASGGY